MEYIRKRYNPIVDLLKFTSNKKILKLYPKVTTNFAKKIIYYCFIRHTDK